MTPKQYYNPTVADYVDAAIQHIDNAIAELNEGKKLGYIRASFFKEHISPLRERRRALSKWRREAW